MAAPESERFREHGHLFLVADGMGGHAVGEKASAKAVRDIPHTYHKHVAEGPDKALEARVRRNQCRHFRHRPGEPGVPRARDDGERTAAPAEGAWIAHVGDSRVYRVRAGQIDQLTFDHSAVWEIARRQQVSPGELQGIRSNVILRSLGPDSLVDVDIEGPHPILPGDIFLLCSDGLSGQLTDYEIGAVAASLPPEEACDFLVELANLRGGPDNITVLIARVGSADKPPVQVIDANLPKPPRRGVPWPLIVLFAGIALAILAVVLKAAELPGVMPAFVVATAVIGIGLFGIGLHSQREPARELESPKPRLNVYSTDPMSDRAATPRQTDRGGEYAQAASR